MARKNIDKDGYIPVGPKYDPPVVPKGIKCVTCGAKFDYGVTYGYSCAADNCPLQDKFIVAAPDPTDHPRHGISYVKPLERESADPVGMSWNGGVW